MRAILSIPALAVVVLIYNLFAMAGGMLETESLVYDTTLPSGAEIFFKIGDIFVVIGLVALFLLVVRRSRVAALGSLSTHRRSTRLAGGRHHLRRRRDGRRQVPVLPRDHLRHGSVGWQA